MQTISQHIRFDTHGLKPTDGGFIVYQPHQGEYLVSALTRIQITEAWDGNLPTLMLWAGEEHTNPHESLNSHWAAGIALQALQGDASTDGVGRSVTVLDGGMTFDAVWDQMAHPIRAIVDQSDAGDTVADDRAWPGCTRGAATIHLTFLQA